MKIYIGKMDLSESSLGGWEAINQCSFDFVKKIIIVIQYDKF